MTLRNDELLKEFKEKCNLTDTLNDLQVREIVHSPWHHLRNLIEGAEVNSMRIKYFGLFQLHPKRAKGILNNLKRKYELGSLKEEDYIKYKTMLGNFLNE